MRLVGLIVASIALLSTSTAFALNPATPEDRAEINELIKSAKMDQDLIDIETPALEIANARAIDRTETDPGHWKQEAAELSESLRELKRSRDLSFDKAIHRTLAAYGIVETDEADRLQMPEGRCVISGPFNGETIYWKPVASENTERVYQTPGGRIGIRRPIKINGAAARGTEDGVTIVYAAAFQSPEYLALVLSHEMDHFGQYTTTGRGDRMTPNEREVDAWSHTKDAIDSLGFDRTTAGEIRDQVEDTLKYYKNAVAKDRAWAKWTLGLKRPADVLFAPHVVGEVDLFQKRFDEIDATVAEEIQVAKARAHEQEQLSASDGTPTHDRNVDIPTAVPFTEHYGARLGRLARIACQSSAALTDELVHREFPDGWVHHEDLGDCDSGSHLFVLPPSYCATAVFRIVCSQEGEPVYVDRTRLRAAANSLIAPAVPAPPARRSPTTNPPASPAPPFDPAPEKPRKDPGNRDCYQGPGEPQGCPQ